MKRLLVIAVLMSTLSGCRVVKVVNHGEGKGWEVYHNSHWLKSEADSLAATVKPDGTIEFSLNGLKSSPSEEFNKMMQINMSALTSLARIAAGLPVQEAVSVQMEESAPVWMEGSSDE